MSRGPVERAALAGVALHLVAAGGAVAAHPLRGPHTVAAVGLAAAGTALLAIGFLRAVGRSRDEVVGLGGVFWLAGGVAPAAVARLLRAGLAVQVVGGVAAAAARPYTSLAFSVLAPMWSLGCLTLWGGTSGAFPPRVGGPAQVRGPVADGEVAGWESSDAEEEDP